uniref:NADH-ubiquinone oxidoreductase chain 4L n=1 Tax=Coleoptera sp. 2 AH-2016 TaxID=1903824 RepID=A0A343C2G1_9COLE|nr:NADH dehydrogenase subunit 4L [Coleoptera sp. 2 AH-2016]
MMFMSGVITFSLKSKHLLIMLMSLELLVLSLYLGLFSTLSVMNECFLSMIFLSMSVCEGALGLSILVMMIRGYGNDYLQSNSLLW